MLYNIPVSKINSVVVFDDEQLEGSTALSQAGAIFAKDYGMRQWLADAHAQVTEKTHPIPSERIAEAQKRVDARVLALRTGVGLPSTSAVDPLWVEAANAGVSREALMAFIKSQAKPAVATTDTGSPPMEGTPTVAEIVSAEDVKKRRAR